VFTNHQQSYTIERDYNQLVQVGFQNTDTIAHTLTATVTNPYTDLITNFVDSGSVDQTITCSLVRPSRSPWRCMPRMPPSRTIS